MSPLLEIDGLSVDYLTDEGVVHAVDQVSFFVDAGDLMDQGFDVAQHPVDIDSKLIERITSPAGRQALAQIAGYDTLDSPVDFQEPVLSTPAQH